MSEEREILVLLLQLKPEASVVLCFTSYNFFWLCLGKKKKNQANNTPPPQLRIWRHQGQNYVSLKLWRHSQHCRAAGLIILPISGWIFTRLGCNFAILRGGVGNGVGCSIFKWSLIQTSFFSRIFFSLSDQHSLHSSYYAIKKKIKSWLQSDYDHFTDRITQL